MNAGAQAFKERARDQWDRAAPGWDAHTPVLREWLGHATAAMLEMAGVRPGQRVLDVAAGAGDQTVDVAHRVGPGGAVVATDLSPEILDRARERARQLGLDQVTTQVADAEDLPLPAASFDAAVCRLGLMLMPDPAQALRELHRVVRPGGSVCVMVFGRPERNPCVTTLLRTARAHAGLPPPDPAQAGGPLSLGEPGLLDRLLREAGFADVASTTLEAPFRLPSARHYLDFVRTSATPIQGILAQAGPEAARAAWTEMEERLGNYEGVDGWCGPNELLLTAGRR